MLQLIKTFEELLEHRDAVVALLRRLAGVEKILELAGIEDYLASITTGKDFLFLDRDGEGTVKSLAIASFVEYPKKRVFRINGTAGTLDASWESKLSELEDFGRQGGAQAIEFWARPGFYRFLKKARFQVSMYDFVKEI